MRRPASRSTFSLTRKENDEENLYLNQFMDEDAPDAIPVYDADGVTELGLFTFGDK